LIFFFTSPVVTHALAQAALAADVEPQLANDRRARGVKSGEKHAGKPENA
jgi:multisubunit Na+/H+ antiporter MnhG subunit